MKVNVLLFGRLISISESKEITVFVEGETCTVRELLLSIYGDYPSMRDEKFRVVLNQSIAWDNDSIIDSDEVALLPPISGGNYSYLTENPITHEFVESVSQRQDNSTGSVLIFLGIVRNDNVAQKSGTEKTIKEVKSLTYSSYDRMAEKEINEIILSAKENFGLTDVVVRHRIGEVKVREIAFFVAVSSGHRKESIRGIDFIIDEVKSKVPVWKLENYHDGSESWKDGKLIE